MNRVTDKVINVNNIKLYIYTESVGVRSYHVQIYTHVHKYIHPRTGIYARLRADTHKYIHTHSQTRTHSRTQTSNTSYKQKRKTNIYIPANQYQQTHQRIVSTVNGIF